MTSPYDKDIENLLGDYREQVARLGETTRRMREVTASATAPRRTVTATVGGQGELVSLEFPSDSYRELPPRELAAIIVATVTEARKLAGDKVAEIVVQGAPAGLDLAALRAGFPDVGDLLPPEPRIPDLQDQRPGADRG